MTYIAIILFCTILLMLGGFLQKEWICTIAIIIGIITGVTSCNQSEWNQQSNREAAQREAKEAQPHVIREADGCKVYAFKSGERWHYFTKCGSNTTTESSYNVSCGKNCSKTEVETIVTENKK